MDIIFKLSNRTVKSLFVFSDTIHAGANLMLMCAQIASKIEQEQEKTLWVPSGTIW